MFDLINTDYFNEESLNSSMDEVMQVPSNTRGNG